MRKQKFIDIPATDAALRIEYIRQEGVGNRADPTAWCTHFVEADLLRPGGSILGITASLMGVFETTLTVRLWFRGDWRTIGFVSSAVNSRWHGLVERLWDVIEVGQEEVWHG